MDEWSIVVHQLQLGLVYTAIYSITSTLELLVLNANSSTIKTERSGPQQWSA